MTGPQFREHRKRLGISQAQLAQYLDVNVNTVCQWERRASLPLLLSQALAAIERLNEGE